MLFISFCMNLNRVSILLVLLIGSIFLSGCVDTNPTSDKSGFDQGEKEVNEIITILNDFGLNEQDIIESIKMIGDYSKDLIIKEESEDYIVAHHDAIYGDISEIESNKYNIAHDILKWSKIGIYSDWKYDDESILSNINSNLKIHGLKTNFSTHEWDEDFKITIENGDQSVSSDFRYSTASNGHDMNELINTINQLLKNFNLIYVDSDSGGDDYTFLLFELDQYSNIKSKYGSELNKILMPWKKSNY